MLKCLIIQLDDFIPPKESRSVVSKLPEQRRTVISIPSVASFPEFELSASDLLRLYEPGKWLNDNIVYSAFCIARASIGPTISLLDSLTVKVVANSTKTHNSADFLVCMISLRFRSI